MCIERARAGGDEIVEGPDTFYEYAAPYSPATRSGVTTRQLCAMQERCCLWPTSQRGRPPS